MPRCEACAPGTQLCRRCCSSASNWSLACTIHPHLAVDSQMWQEWPVWFELKCHVWGWHGIFLGICTSYSARQMVSCNLAYSRELAHWMWHIQCKICILYWFPKLITKHYTCIWNPPSNPPVSEPKESMSYGSSQKVQKVMVQPINLIFRYSFPSISQLRFIWYP